MFFFNRAPRVVESKDYVVLGDRLIEFTVRENPSAKSLSVSVNHARGLVATLPPRFPRGELTSFLLKKEQWVLKKLDYYASFPKPHEFRAVDGAGIRFLGADYALRITIVPGRSRVELDEAAGELRVRVPSTSPSVMRRALIAWYKKQAQRVFAARTRFYCEQMNLRFEKIFVRSQRTRWGTCSAKRNVGFNWRLVLAPLEVVDYVVVHELAHLRELNHSPRFWEIVARHCPDYKERRKWLKKNEAALGF